MICRLIYSERLDFRAGNRLLMFLNTIQFFSVLNFMLNVLGLAIRCS